MRRRKFAALFGGSAMPLLVPVTTFAQKPDKRLTIGFVGANSPEINRPYLDAFVRRLGQLGWDQSRNVAVEYRSAGGSVERAGEIAAEFVRLRVDLIVTTA